MCWCLEYCSDFDSLAHLPPSWINSPDQWRSDERVVEEVRHTKIFC